MNALLLGATGATGRDLLNQLLEDESFTEVEIFVRRPLETMHSKLRTHIIDFDSPAQWESLVAGDVLFSCLGTTLKAAGSKKGQWKVDHDYQLDFAKAAAANAVPVYVLISAARASADSVFFYSKMKGRLEEEVKALSFRQTVILRPPLLIRKNSDRPMEKIGEGTLRFFNSLGLFKSQKPLRTEHLAAAMIHLSKTGREGLTVVEGAQIEDLLSEH